MHHSTKPSRIVCSSDPSRPHSFFMGDPVRFSSASLCCGIGKQLNLTCLVKCIKPADGFLNCLANGQQPMISKQGSLLVTKTLGYISSFFLSKNGAFAFKDDVILTAGYARESKGSLSPAHLIEPA